MTTIRPGKELTIRNKLINILRYLRLVARGDRYTWNISFKRWARPVLLIHGFAMPQQCMAMIENRLTADGFDVFAIRLGPANFLGVEKSARIIGMKLKHLERRYGMNKIAIVGHSLGGIVGRAFILLRRGDRVCHTLITLGSPHRGHPSWRWSRFTPVTWFTHVPRDLAPESPIMKRLNRLPIPSSVHAVSIYSEQDSICPASICDLDVPHGADHVVNVSIPGLSHLDLMMGESVYDIIRAHLDIGFARAHKEPSDPDETLPLLDR